MASESYPAFEAGEPTDYMHELVVGMVDAQTLRDELSVYSQSESDAIGVANIEDTDDGVRVDDGLGGLGELEAESVQATYFISGDGNVEINPTLIWQNITSEWQPGIRLRTASNNGITWRVRASNGAFWHEFGDKDGYAYVKIYTVGLKAGALIVRPPSSLTLDGNGELSFEMTSNTTGNVVYRGSDGVTRRSALTFN